jgi:hypothetical protein
LLSTRTACSALWYCQGVCDQSDLHMGTHKLPSSAVAAWRTTVSISLKLPDHSATVTYPNTVKDSALANKGHFHSLVCRSKISPVCGGARSARGLCNFETRHQVDLVQRDGVCSLLFCLAVYLSLYECSAHGGQCGQRFTTRNSLGSLLASLRKPNYSR